MKTLERRPSKMALFAKIVNVFLANDVVQNHWVAQRSTLPLIFPRLIR